LDSPHHTGPLPAFPPAAPLKPARERAPDAGSLLGKPPTGPLGGAPGQESAIGAEGSAAAAPQTPPLAPPNGAAPLFAAIGQALGAVDAAQEARSDALLVAASEARAGTRRKARDFYVSEIFGLQRTIAEGRRRPWYVMSARNGLLHPEAAVDPYLETFGHMTAEELTRWAARIAGQVEVALGGLSGLVLEIHAEDAVITALEQAFLATGAWVYAPLRTASPSDRVQWYEGRTAHMPDTRQRRDRPVPTPRPETRTTGQARGLSRRITEEFCQGEWDVTRRKNRGTSPLGRDTFGAPPDAAPSRNPKWQSGWSALPEVVVAGMLRDAGAGDPEVRRFLTFAAAMNRGQDPDRLWLAALDLLREAPWAFVPERAARAGPQALEAALDLAQLSQAPQVDAAAWQTIARAFAPVDRAPSDGESAVIQAVAHGEGDAAELLAALDEIDPETGAKRFPLLCAPRTAARWIRMLAVPGKARIAHLARLPLTVDASVRRATECLGISQTRGLPLEDVRAPISDLWWEDVDALGTAGPPELEDTAAALEPALTFMGRWGCFACERAQTRLPIGPICAECRL
jgi:hypothetical protein